MKRGRLVAVIGPALALGLWLAAGLEARAASV
jgi:hypothetical protein